MPGNVCVQVVHVDAVETEVDDVDAGPLVGEEAALGVLLTVSGDHLGQLDLLFELPGGHVEHEDVMLPLKDNAEMNRKILHIYG